MVNFILCLEMKNLLVRLLLILLLLAGIGLGFGVSQLGDVYEARKIADAFFQDRVEGLNPINPYAFNKWKTSESGRLAEMLQSVQQESGSLKGYRLSHFFTKKTLAGATVVELSYTTYYNEDIFRKETLLLQKEKKDHGLFEIMHYSTEALLHVEDKTALAASIANEEVSWRKSEYLLFVGLIIFVMLGYFLVRMFMSGSLMWLASKLTGFKVHYLEMIVLAEIAAFIETVFFVGVIWLVA